MKEINDINSEFKKYLTDYQKEVVPLLLWNLKDKRYIHSENLYNSIKISMTEKGKVDYDLLFEMPQYGTALEKRYRFAQGAPVEVLAQWVEAQGLHNFKSIPGYENSNFVPADAATRIAWAIKKSKKRSRTLENPSILYSWFYKPFYGLWKEKRNLITETYFAKIPASVISKTSKMFQDSVNALPKHGQ